jgi:hypothetical protein
MSDPRSRRLLLVGSILILGAGLAGAVPPDYWDPPPPG